MNELRTSLVARARILGVYVDEINHDLFVSAPVLSMPCVRCDDIGMQDVIARMKVYRDSRTIHERARDALVHNYLVQLMGASKKFAAEQAMLFYHPKQRVVKDFRISERYMIAKRDAQRMAMHDSVDKL